MTEDKTECYVARCPSTWGQGKTPEEAVSNCLAYASLNSLVPMRVCRVEGDFEVNHVHGSLSADVVDVEYFTVHDALLLASSQARGAVRTLRMLQQFLGTILGDSQALKAAQAARSALTDAVDRIDDVVPSVEILNTSLDSTETEVPQR